MKYTREVVIELPRDRVVELFDNPRNLSKWQEGLKKFQHVSGRMGHPGAKSRMLYEHRGQEVEMIETITERNLPDEFSGIYETEGVWNLMQNRFVEDGPDRTRWLAETEFRFSDLKMRLTSFVMRPMFKRQTLKVMRDFKRFAEGEGLAE